MEAEAVSKGMLGEKKKERFAYQVSDAVAEQVKASESVHGRHTPALP